MHHPDRARIECAKVAGRGLDDVAEELSIHRDALWRHMQRHVTAETKIGYLAGPAKLSELANLAADENKSLIEYLSILHSIFFGQLDRSAQLNKPYEVERIGGRVLDTLKEIGRLTGELSAFTSQTVNITNNVAILNSAPFLDLQAGLLSICARHPAARADIVALFRDLDPEACCAGCGEDDRGARRCMRNRKAIRSFRGWPMPLRVIGPLKPGRSNYRRRAIIGAFGAF